MKKIIFITVLALGLNGFLMGQITVNSYNNVGIGTSTPQAKLHIEGTVRGHDNGAITVNTGNGDIDIGPKNTSWCHFTTNRNSYYFNTKFIVNTGQIGSYDENLSLLTNHSTVRMTIRNDNGYVGIATTTPSYLLDVAGHIRCATLTENSDIRLKENVQNMSNMLSKVEKLQPISYNLKMYEEVPVINDTTATGEIAIASQTSNKKETIDEKVRYGLSAQEVQKLFPEVVFEDDEGYLSVSYTSLVPVLIEAIKEQQLQIDALEEKLTKTNTLAKEN